MSRDVVGNKGLFSPKSEHPEGIGNVRTDVFGTNTVH